MNKVVCPGCGEVIITTAPVKLSTIVCPKCGKSEESILLEIKECDADGNRRCAFCGSIIGAECSDCTVCGYSQPLREEVHFSRVNTPVSPSAPTKKKLSVWMGFLCLIVPFLGIILWWKDRNESKGKAVLEFALSVYPSAMCIIGPIIGMSQGTPSGDNVNRQIGATHVQTETDAWYEGGNLHQANGLEWQQATYQNKLATCADIICMMWQEGHLRSDLAASIHEMDDIRPLADSLVRALNTAFEPYPDTELNEQVYTNQSVADFAALILEMCGWWQ